MLFLLLAPGCARQQVDNVLLIVVDTLRADHLSFYGYTRPTSPELAQWASRGLVFEHALATSSWTLPTFGSVLTGLWPAQHAAGVRAPEGGKKWRRAPLSPAARTLPELLQGEGFATAAIVNNAFLRPHFGVARGFDHYDYEKGRRAAAVVDETRAWLNEMDRQSFFLMVHFIDPHLPYEPPEDLLGRFGEVSAEAVQPRGRKRIVDQLETLNELDRSTLTARYDEEIAGLDRELGRLLRHLDESGLLARTLVVLTSDHGEELFDHGGFEHGHSMYQEVLRVPLVLWAPGLEAGRVATPISLVDLMPTLGEALGLPLPEDLAGSSRWQNLRAGKGWERQEILAQNTLWGREHRALIYWPYKLILDPRSGHKRLFDLSADPLEREDLAAEETAVVAELERRLRDRLAGLETRPSETGVELTEEVAEELRALGYLD